MNELGFPGGRKLDYASDAPPGQFFREWADPSNGYHENWVVTPWAIDQSTLIHQKQD